MIRFSTFPLLLVLLLAAATAHAGGLEVGRASPGFALDSGDETVTLQGTLEAEGTKAVVVYVASYTCPYSLRADRELKPQLPEFERQGVRFIAIYPNQHETADELLAYAGKQGFTHTMLRDPDAAVTRALGAEVTPTFYLLDRTGFLRYRGNLAGLASAVTAVLTGQEVANATTPATGCTVKWPDAKVPERPMVDPLDPRAGDTGEAPAREVPRRGPPDAAPPAPSPAAEKWIRRLIRTLQSEDPLVARSAGAGLMAIGPPAMPQLRAAFEAAEGDARQRIGRVMEQVAAGGRRPLPPGAPGEGRGAGPGERGRGSLVDRQRERIEAALDLTEEQQAQVTELFDRLKAREAELRAGGDPEGAREAFRELMLEARTGLAGILTEEQLRELENLRGGMRGGPGGGRRGPGGGGRGPEPGRERDR